ncbi:putative transmembrane protein 244 isoform X2 [Saimiri boliviensis]|uniref:putative transmembrane protein 244 isoform X2 n=1 Tax=Saimiri boliviensis TaxID=27679 RepID=UPI003D785531
MDLSFETMIVLKIHMKDKRKKMDPSRVQRFVVLTCKYPALYTCSVLLVSTEVTYFACGLLFVPVAEEWVWDYAISVTILHVAITSTVMLEFPLTSHWWAALDGHPEILLHRILRLLLHRCDACCLCGTGLISMICGGQTLAYCLFKDNFIYPDLDNF